MSAELLMLGSAQRHTVPAVREQNRPMGRVDSPALRVPRAKAVQRRYMLTPRGAHTSGNSEKNRHHAIRAGKGRSLRMGNIHDTENGSRASLAWLPRSAAPRQTCMTKVVPAV